MKNKVKGVQARRFQNCFKHILDRSRWIGKIDPVCSLIARIARKNNCPINNQFFKVSKIEKIYIHPEKSHNLF